MDKEIATAWARHFCKFLFLGLLITFTPQVPAQSLTNVVSASSALRDPALVVDGGYTSKPDKFYRSRTQSGYRREYVNYF